MNQRDDLDRMLDAWLDEPYAAPTSRILGKVLERTQRTRQRRAWASLERWLPMAVITRPAVAPPLRVAWLLLLALLIVALGTGGAIVGSRLLGITAPYPIPQGDAAVLVLDTYGPQDAQAGDIYTVRADGTDVRQLTGGPAADMAPSWSPDGTRVAYRPWQDGTRSLVVMDAGGGSPTTLATNSQASKLCTTYDTITAGIGVWEPAAWSPDGRALVYPVSAACDGRFDLFIVAADGSSPATRLLVPGLNGSAAAWSPDGTRIAFAGTEETGDTALYVVDVGRSEALSGGLPAHRITEAGPVLDWLAPRWSPDGTQLAAAAGMNDNCSGTMDAFVVEADGSGQRTIAAEAAKEYNPTWSPDGKRLAFQRTVDPDERVNGRPCTMATWVIDADGTNERRLAGLGTDNSQPPLWSPDGTLIVGNTVDVIDGVEHYDMIVVAVDDDVPMVTVDDVGIASWQPLAAPLPPAPTFPAASPAS